MRLGFPVTLSRTMPVRFGSSAANNAGDDPDWARKLTGGLPGKKTAPRVELMVHMHNVPDQDTLDEMRRRGMHINDPTDRKLLRGFAYGAALEPLAKMRAVHYLSDMDPTPHPKRPA